MRALVFALAVLAQLLLPAIVLRAEAAAGELCFMQSNQSGSQNSKSHSHDQQCAQCALHQCAPLTPPAVQAVAAIPAYSGAAPLSTVTDAGTLFRRIQPPPTGPPAL